MGGGQAEYQVTRRRDYYGMVPTVAAGDLAAEQLAYRLRELRLLMLKV